MKPRILIVDDTNANLYMLETILKSNGMETVSAENGEIALEKARLDPPDLIVTDILMPVMDGYELCRTWKSEDALKRIPLVFLTATYTDSKDEAFALSLGADRFITEPQEPEVLMKIIREVLADSYEAIQIAPKPLGEEMEFFRQHNELLFKKLEKKMDDLEKANGKLRILEERYRLSLENVADVILTLDADRTITSVSQSIKTVFGYEPRDFVGRLIQNAGKILTPESSEQAKADIARILAGETITGSVSRVVAKDGTLRDVEVSGSPILRDDCVIGVVAVIRDITERKQAWDRERLARETLDILNRSTDAEGAVRDILLSVKRTMDFDAVGIRLRDGDDFPYYLTNGLEEDFILTERFLCPRDAAGEALRDPEGKPVLECMCGNVLCRRTDPSQPFFTPRGSFWTNSTTRLLAATTETEGLGKMRNRCNRDGYESVALIPLMAGDTIIGLLQLNDRRPNRLTLGMVQFFEDLSASVGIALDRKRAEETLRKSRELLNETQQITKAGGWEYDAATKKVVWTDEVYEIYGVPKDFDPSHPDTDISFFAPEDQERFADSFNHCVARGEPFDLELRLITGLGEGKWVRTRGKAERKEGEIVRVFGNIVDITERKRAESALAESDRKLREAQNLAQLGYWYWDVHSGEVEWSDEVYGIFGLIPGQFKPQIDSIQEFSPWPEDHERDKELIRRAMESHEKGNYEQRFLRPDGSIGYYFSTFLGKYDEKGELFAISGTVLDITAQKLATQRLESNYALLTAILNSSKDLIIYSVDKAYRYTAYNAKHREEMKKLWGADIEIGDRILDIVGTPESRSSAKTSLDRAFLGEAFTEMHFQPGPDSYDELIWNPVYQNGDITGATCFVRDVSERKRAEELILVSELRYRRLFESAKDGILILDAETGMIVDANPFLISLLGYSIEEFQGKKVWELGFIRDLIPNEAKFWELSEKGNVRYEDMPLKTSSGRQIDVEFVSNVYLVKRKKVVQCNIRDISARVAAERELQESRHLIESVVENVPLMIFLKEAKDLRFVLFNKAGEELLGYDRKDFLGKNNLDLFPPEQAAFFMAKDREVLAQGHSLDIPEESILTAKKGERTLHTRKICIKGADGVTNYLLGISEDITDRKAAEAEYKKMEEQLQISQKLEAIGGLAGGIAHDFNNLLCVIMSYAGFALDDAGEEKDALKKDLMEILKAAERAASLTRQLLAFSRKQVLQPMPLDLNQIAEGIEKMLRRILGEDIEFVQTLEPDLGVVQADPGQIEQVLMNLVVNARDAMPEGGKLTIETANAEIDDEFAASHVGIRPGPYVRLTVSDTGFGMDERTQARVFEPFFTTKAKGKGTGLGLATVYGIIKQSAGSVTVYSEPGLGTSFKIYLPRDLSAKPVPIGEANRPSKPPRGTETVLVVDDEEGMRRLAIRALTESGYTVLSAANGYEAIRVCEERSGEIHLLLTDVVMPNMSGRVLSQKISILRPAIKVLYMSGYTDEAIVHHGVLDPGTRFLGKPFTAADVARKVREVLDNSAERGRIAGHAAEAMEGIALDKPSIDPESLHSLPRDLLGKMRKAVIAARYDEILALIETIAASFPDVAETFRRMTDLFDYEGLREILDSKKDGKNDR